MYVELLKKRELSAPFYL